jgi:hypothetical protein
MIRELQSKNHVIALMIDANQSHSECFYSKVLKPFSIEWLSLQQRMDDPFVQLTGHHPNSTTQTPNQDIDFILTYGVMLSTFLLRLQITHLIQIIWD